MLTKNNYKASGSNAFLLKEILFVCCTLILLFTAMGASARQNSFAQEIKTLVENLHPVAGKELAENKTPEKTRYTTTQEGYLRHLGAPPLHYFPVAGAVPGKPNETARKFLHEYGRLFGIISPLVDFKTYKSRTKNSRHYERFEQAYAGIPVFAAQVIVQLNKFGGVEYVISDIARDVKALDDGVLSTVPGISSEEAANKVRAYFAAKYPGITVTITSPERKIFDPQVLGVTGSLRLVWSMLVHSDEAVTIDRKVLLDAHNGDIVRQYPLTMHALFRRIRDAENDNGIGSVVREEGETQMMPTILQATPMIFIWMNTGATVSMMMVITLKLPFDTVNRGIAPGAMPCGVTGITGFILVLISQLTILWRTSIPTGSQVGNRNW